MKPSRDEIKQALDNVVNCRDYGQVRSVLERLLKAADEKGAVEDAARRGFNHGD